MPVHHHAYDRHLVERGLTNYWGYNTLASSRPNVALRRVDDPPPTRSASSSAWCARCTPPASRSSSTSSTTTRPKAITSARRCRCAASTTRAYYRLLAENQRYYLDFTGCGNTLNMQSPQVLQLIMDSLRYWVLEMHVDGFRFDLASALARELYEVDRLGAFFDIIHQDPVLSQVKLIAEPWDLGAGGYQVGNFPVLWTEWNGKYRDAVRRVLARRRRRRVRARHAGSPAATTSTSTSGRRPYASINFVTAHDGFTLHDLVSYNEKHNEANGDGQPRRREPQPELELRRRRADRRSARSTRCASGRSATCWPRCCSRRACR